MRFLITGIAFVGTLVLLAALAFGDDATTQPQTSAAQHYPICAATNQPELSAATTQPDRGADTAIGLLKSASETFDGGKGQLDQIVGFIDPQMRPLTIQAIELIRTAANATGRVAGVVEQKIGQRQADQVKQLGVSPDALKEGLQAPLANFAKDGKVDWDKVKVQENENWASVNYNDKPTGIFLVKRDGKWYFGSVDRIDPKELQSTMLMQRQLFCGLLSGLDQIEAKVNAGDLNDKNFREQSTKIMEDAQAVAVK
jgi:hypothetical protein